MNVKFDVDMTPEELRRLMGLPDVQAFNAKVMEDMMTKMKEGAEGYDPMSIFTSSIGSNMDIAKQWMGMMGGFNGNGK
uniref:Uncharacterized protein n=1 Tax=uncultured Thiotrichaceae bacterium TaxID=298394 RepID=A0A6S6TAN7_9GAMM|nr:MAG: Unknown protein [uncultured Thiotrichaceae bacterium]